MVPNPGFYLHKKGPPAKLTLLVPPERHILWHVLLNLIIGASLSTLDRQEERPALILAV